jgi:hypothetical protein
MTLEEAEEKARVAYEMGLIEYEQIEAYIHHLLETHNVINKDVSRGTPIPTDSSNDKE